MTTAVLSYIESCYVFMCPHQIVTFAMTSFPLVWP